MLSPNRRRWARRRRTIALLGPTSLSSRSRWRRNVISRRRGANRYRASGPVPHPPSPRLQPHKRDRAASRDGVTAMPRAQSSRSAWRTAASARRCTSRAARGRPRYCFSTASADPSGRSDRPAPRPPARSVSAEAVAQTNGVVPIEQHVQAAVAVDLVGAALSASRVQTRGFALATSGTTVSRPQTKSGAPDLCDSLCGTRSCRSCQPDESCCFGRRGPPAIAKAHLHGRDSRSALAAVDRLKSRYLGPGVLGCRPSESSAIPRGLSAIGSWQIRLQARPYRRLQGLL